MPEVIPTSVIPVEKRRWPRATRVVKAIVRGLDVVDRFVFTPVAIVALTLLVVLVSADALVRYLLGSGIPFLSVFTGQLMLPLIVFLTLGALAASRGNVWVDLFFSRFPERLQWSLMVVFDLLGAAFMIAIFAAYVPRFVDALAARSTTFVIPMSLQIGIVLVGVGFCAVRFLVSAAADMLGTRRSYIGPEEEVVDGL